MTEQELLDRILELESELDSLRSALRRIADPVSALPVWHGDELWKQWCGDPCRWGWQRIAREALVRLDPKEAEPWAEDDLY